MHIGHLPAPFGIRADDHIFPGGLRITHIHQHARLHHTGIAPYRLRLVLDQLRNRFVADIHLRIDKAVAAVVISAQQQLFHRIASIQLKGKIHTAEGLTLRPAGAVDHRNVGIVVGAVDTGDLSVKQHIPVAAVRRRRAGLIRHRRRRIFQNIIRRGDQLVAVPLAQLGGGGQRRHYAGGCHLAGMDKIILAVALGIRADDQRPSGQVGAAQIDLQPRLDHAIVAPRRLRAGSDQLLQREIAYVDLRVDEPIRRVVISAQQQALKAIRLIKGERKIHAAECVHPGAAHHAHIAAVVGAVDAHHLSVVHHLIPAIPIGSRGAGLIRHGDRRLRQNVIRRGDQLVAVPLAQLRCRDGRCRRRKHAGHRYHAQQQRHTETYAPYASVHPMPSFKLNKNRPFADPPHSSIIGSIAHNCRENIK